MLGALRRMWARARWPAVSSDDDSMMTTAAGWGAQGLMHGWDVQPGAARPLRTLACGYGCGSQDGMAEAINKALLIQAKAWRLRGKPPVPSLGLMSGT
jgi:hypothetical protein